VTIGTTWLTLIAAFVVPCIYLFNKESLSSMKTMLGLVICSAILWLLTGLPLVVSLLIARKLKYAFPAFLLLVSTMTYALWFGFIYSQEFSSRSSDFWMIPYIPLGSIFFMLPLWCIAWNINAILVKNGTSMTKEQY
jgi:hypothetical protein